MLFADLEEQLKDVMWPGIPLRENPPKARFVCCVAMCKLLWFDGWFVSDADPNAFAV